MLVEKKDEVMDSHNYIILGYIQGYVGKENGSYYIILGYIYGYVGIMEKKTEVTILYQGIYRVI